MPDGFVQLAEALLLLSNTILLLWSRSTAKRAALEAKAARNQSEQNGEALSESLNDVHQKINSGLDRQIRQAEERGRHSAPAQILIVDDSKEDLDLMTRELKRLGADVIGLLSDVGVENLIKSRTSSARGYPFDMVCVDLRMVNGASENVMRLFKELAPGVLRCVVTGRARHDSAETLREFEPYSFLTKPITAKTAGELLMQMHIPCKLTVPSRDYEL